MIMGIDPGNTHTAYAIISEVDCFPYRHGKLENEEFASMLKHAHLNVSVYVIERVACYGMAVGHEVFDTCEWIGRFTQIIKDSRLRNPEYILRMDEKMAICHDSKAKDCNIRRALIDQFARHDFKFGKGTKKNPDFFYSFAADEWAAFAVAYTYLKRRRDTNE